MNLTVLQQRIASILNKPGVSDPAQGVALRQSIALELANVIDEYVQSQIGQRLALLPGAIACPSPAGIPTPTPGFAALIRQR